MTDITPTSDIDSLVTAAISKKIDENGDLERNKAYLREHLDDESVEEIMSCARASKTAKMRDDVLGQLESNIIDAYMERNAPLRQSVTKNTGTMTVDYDIEVYDGEKTSITAQTARTG